MNKMRVIDLEHQLKMRDEYIKELEESLASAMNIIDQFVPVKTLLSKKEGREYLMNLMDAVDKQ